MVDSETVQVVPEDDSEVVPQNAANASDDVDMDIMNDGQLPQPDDASKVRKARCFCFKYPNLSVGWVSMEIIENGI